MDIFKYVVQLFQSTYLLYWREGGLGLALILFSWALTITTFSIIVSNKYLKPLTRALKAYCDNPFHSQAKRFPFQVVLSIIDKIVFHFLAAIIFSIFVHVFIRLPEGERLLLPLDKTQFSILISDFEGPDLSDQYGAFGIRNKIEAEIRSFSAPALKNNIEIRFSNYKFKSQNDAEAWRAKRGADLLLWGFSEKGTDSLRIQLYFASENTIMFGPQYDTNQYIGFTLPDSVAIDLPRRKGYHSDMLVNWIDKIASLILIRDALYEENYRSAIKYSRLLDSADATFQRSDTMLGERLFGLMLRTKAYEKLTQWDSLIDECSTADSILKGEGFAELQYGLLSVVTSTKAWGFLNLHDTAHAIMCFEESLRQDDRNTDALFNLCQIYWNKQMYDSVYSNAIKGMKYYPNDANLNIHLGRVLLLRGENRAALQHFRTAWSTPSSDKYLVGTLCALSCEAGEYDSCLTYSDEYYRITNANDGVILFWRMCALVQKGRYNEVGKILETNMAEYPCLIIIELDVAKMLYTLGRTEEAKTHYNLVTSRMDRAQIESCAQSFMLNPSSLGYPRVY